MDSLTQGLLGGVAAQALCGRRLPKTAWLIGTAAGLAADLDLFIRPNSDPLGGLTYHRHFTHALAFIPLGGLLAALPFLPFRAFAGRRWAVVAAALVAYATHGLLDACTSYGTLLYWPFSDARVAWDFIGIIDPVYTLILLVGLVWAVRVRKARVAAAAWLLSTLYIGLGAVQHHRAAAVQRQLAAARGQRIERGRALPTLGNLILWRSIYEADGCLHADAVCVPFFAAPTVHRGTLTPRLTLAVLEANGPWAPGARRAFERFAWFADDYTAYDANDPRAVGDMRYATRPDVFASLWGLHLPGPEPGGAPRFVQLPGSRGDGLRYVWEAVRGRSPLFQPIDAAIRREAQPPRTQLDDP